MGERFRSASVRVSFPTIKSCAEIAPSLGPIPQKPQRITDDLALVCCSRPRVVAQPQNR